MVPLPIPPARLVEEEVERLAASDALRRAPGHQRLLHYLVAKRLAGDEAALRETAIALDVFRRDPATYDPQVDPIVRVNIGRLRERLEAHYANFDRTPKLRIVLPRGRYAPDFVAESDPPASLPGLQAAPALPAYLTRCFGVERQVAGIRERLTAHRLVTLLGPGGSGKTRLAVELARAVRDAPAAGDDGAAPAFDVVAFVPLAACADLPAMHDALRGAFALPASPVGVVEQLGTHAGRSTRAAGPRQPRTAAAAGQRPGARAAGGAAPAARARHLAHRPRAGRRVRVPDFAAGAAGARCRHGMKWPPRPRWRCSSTAPRRCAPTSASGPDNAAQAAADRPDARRAAARHRARRLARAQLLSRPDPAPPARRGRRRPTGHAPRV